MKTKLAMLALAAAVSVAGCKSIPSVDRMYSYSEAIGYAAGLVANQIKMDNTVRNGVIEVWNEVVQCVPATNETFSAAWTPIAEAHIAKLVADGKIDRKAGDLILLGFKAAVAGLDFVFVKYPKAKEYEELTVAVIGGFSEGFLTVFKPVNLLGSRWTAYRDYDKEAYDYLKKLVL